MVMAASEIKQCVEGYLPQWLPDRSNDDAGPLGPLGWRWLVGGHVIKPGMRTIRGRKRWTGKLRRGGRVREVCEPASWVRGREGGERRRRRSDGDGDRVTSCCSTLTPTINTRSLLHPIRLIAPLPRFSLSVVPYLPLLLPSSSSSVSNHGRRSSHNRKWTPGGQKVGPHWHPHDQFCCFWCVAPNPCSSLLSLLLS